jgi:hypothetical protein
MNGSGILRNTPFTKSPIIIYDVKHMKCLLIFGAENAHPLAWMLNRKRRHVWCALQDVERGVWVSYNWHKGLPVIQAEAAADYDLATHYRAQGFAVVEVERGTEPSFVAVGYE